MDSRTVICRVVDEGWYEVRIAGGHHHFRHPTRPGIVTVPHLKKDPPIGTLRSIERQSGVKLS